ncbi:MAG TPA: TIGR04282 family arsenosugar biosynthesis glycosyltransferase [Verrucomicrobiae bacterium]|nr:TIGR04282 family arsenosugar biosynthesis glycosyltransferase [Verrucomicrobiae bacterium]
MIFARRPSPGTVKTRLARSMGEEAAAELYRCMLFDVVEKAASLRQAEPVIFYVRDAEAAAYFAENFPGLEAFPQAEGGLGERLTAAFGAMFAAGRRKCVAIGTDSPDLPAEYLADAFRLLQEKEGRVVLGPAADGGYWLIGMDRLRPPLFRDIPWSTDAVLRSTIERCGEEAADHALLPEWYDVDVAEDLLRPGLLAPDSGAPRTRQFLRGLPGISRRG